MHLLFERISIEFINPFPEIPVGALEIKILPVFQIVEEPFFQNTNCAFDTAFKFGAVNFCCRDDGTVMFRPVCIIFVKVRLYPVLVSQNSLFAVVAGHEWGYPAKIGKCMVIDLYPLWFLCRGHSFRISLL